MKGKPLSDLEIKVIAFWSKVKKGPECWEWMGAKTKDGYGNHCLDGRGSGTSCHRIAWFLSHGYWPPKDLHHICVNPGCVRPSHMKCLSRSENILERQMSKVCKYGHPLKDPNLYYYKRKGKRVRRCLACIMRERKKKSS